MLAQVLLARCLLLRVRTHSPGTLDFKELTKVLRAPPRETPPPSAKEGLKKAVALQKAAKAFGNAGKPSEPAGAGGLQKAAKAFGKPK